MRAANLVSMVIRAAGIAVSGIPAGPYRCAVLGGAGQEESVGCLCHIALSPSAIGVQFFDPNHRHRPEIPRLIAARGSAKYQSSPRRNAEHVERRVAAGSAEHDVACDTRRAECVVTHRRNGRVGQCGRIRRRCCGQGNPNAEQPAKHGNRGSCWDLHSVHYAPTHTPAQDNSLGPLALVASSMVRRAMQSTETSLPEPNLSASGFRAPISVDTHADPSLACGVTMRTMPMNLGTGVT